MIMRIYILSDLHLEFRLPWRWPDDRENYDLVVAAGDIETSLRRGRRSAHRPRPDRGSSRRNARRLQPTRLRERKQGVRSPLDNRDLTP